MKLADVIKYQALQAGGPGSGRPAGGSSIDDVAKKHGFTEGKWMNGNPTYKHPEKGFISTKGTSWVHSDNNATTNSGKGGGSLDQFLTHSQGKSSDDEGSPAHDYWNHG